MISLVIPMLNEQENVASVYARVSDAAAAWGDDYEVIVVDDGSTDGTGEILTKVCLEDPRWKVLSFSRNFGHQSAVSAGMRHSSGDVVGIIDGDLQDPPEVIAELLEKWREGFQVAYAVRRKRKEHLLKRFAYAAFYRTMKRIASIDVPLDSGDFCVMDRAVVDVLNALPERERFVRGLRSWAGFKQTGVEYERSARHDGVPKYTLVKLIALATNGLVSFSSAPLRLASWLGFAMCGCSAMITVLLAAWWLSNIRIAGINPADTVGWTSMICVVQFLTGVQLLMTGIVGEYIARIFDEVKGRPAWIIARAINFEVSTENLASWNHTSTAGEPQTTQPHAAGVGTPSPGREVPPEAENDRLGTERLANAR
jgi:glycosyltransferase involved in cell wall biosynthesis